MLQSIHAFGDSTVGPYILGLIAVVLIGSTVLIVSRLDDLRSEKRIDSLASREAVFLVNNLLLVAMTAVIFWGTFFPLISELFTGDKASLAAPWFDRYTTPLAILLVLFTGIGPLLAWRRVSWASAKRVFVWPAAVAAGGGVAAGAGHRCRRQAVGASRCSSSPSSPWRRSPRSSGAAAGRGARLAGGSIPAAIFAVAARNRRRYGGYIVHAGLAVLLVGIAASSSFQTNRDVTLRPGQSAGVGDYRVTYERPTVSVDREALTFGAVLDVKRDGKAVRPAQPQPALLPADRRPDPKHRQLFRGESTSEVGLKTGARSDFWTAVQPNIGGVQRKVRAADRGFRDCVRAVPGTPPQCRAVNALMRNAAANPSLRPLALAQINDLQSRTADRLAHSFLAENAAATFRVIVDPLVTWMWIGGLIAAGRCADRDLAGPRGRPAAGLQLRRRPARARPFPGLNGRWRSSTAPFCSPWWRPSCSAPAPRAGAGEFRRGSGSRRPGGTQGGEVPRDPRYRARPCLGQALRPGLSRPGRAAALGGG